jgi:CHAD domain-containing protein
MAYQFKLKETPGDGMRRILHEQVGHCLKSLAAEKDKAKGIHESRKSIKRIRALLRLMRTGLSEPVFRVENQRYRDISRLLGGQRDRDVLRATLDWLESENSEPGDNRFSQVRLATESLNGPAGSAGAELAAILAKARRLLRKAKRDVDKLAVDPDRFDTIGEGLEHTIRRCRVAFGVADASDDPLTWHEWRKTVQQHWRQMRLIERAWPEHYGVRSALAAELSDVLGRAQDLVMFQRFLGSTACSPLAEDMRASLDQMAAEATQRLRDEARPLGHRLLAEGPRGLRRRAAVYWEVARDMKRVGAKKSVPTHGGKPHRRVA